MFTTLVAVSQAVTCLVSVALWLALLDLVSVGREHFARCTSVDANEKQSIAKRRIRLMTWHC
jgi:hypothetical protein